MLLFHHHTKFVGTERGEEVKKRKLQYQCMRLVIQLRINKFDISSFTSLTHSDWMNFNGRHCHTLAHKASFSFPGLSVGLIKHKITTSTALSHYKTFPVILRSLGGRWERNGRCWEDCSDGRPITLPSTTAGQQAPTRLTCVFDVVQVFAMKCHSIKSMWSAGHLGRAAG